MRNADCGIIEKGIQEREFRIPNKEVNLIPSSHDIESCKKKENSNLSKGGKGGEEKGQTSNRRSV
jgi:hypothetical protein